MKYIGHSLVTLVFSVFVFSCTYENREDLLVGEGGETIPDTVSFALDVQPLLVANCNQNGCHAAGTGSRRGDFSSYPGVKSKVDNGTFEKEVIVDQTMPPNRTLSDGEIQIFQRWIDQGALNN